MGIFFNTNTNILRIHVLWGSANGFTDLSADVFKLHLHGPTPDAGTAAFGQTAPLLLTLSNSSTFDGSATSGGVNDIWAIDDDDVATSPGSSTSPKLLDGHSDAHSLVPDATVDTNGMTGPPRHLPRPRRLCDEVP